MLSIGIKGTSEIVVTEENCAANVGSGTLPVFATPSMIALIEKTAWTSIAPFLEEGQGSVGTKLDVSHVSATPLGMKVTCETILTDIDRRKLTFNAKVWDEAGLIGEGTHERFIIDEERFMKKTAEKR